MGFAMQRRLCILSGAFGLSEKSDSAHQWVEEDNSAHQWVEENNTVHKWVGGKD